MTASSNLRIYGEGGKVTCSDVDKRLDQIAVYRSNYATDTLT